MSTVPVSDAQAERSARSERKARGSGHLRRAELLAAAERIFMAEGYEGATIRKIADEVGVSPTALYMYFQDKSQIMLEICARALEALYTQLSSLAALPLEPELRLRRMLEAMLEFGFRQPTAYQMLYCVVPREVSERREGLTTPLSRACFDLIQGAAEQAVAAGGLRADLSPRAMAEALVAACHGVVAIRIANPGAPWTEPEVISRTLLDGLFNGFKAP